MIYGTCNERDPENGEVQLSEIQFNISDFHQIVFQTKKIRHVTWVEIVRCEVDAVVAYPANHPDPIPQFLVLQISYDYDHL